jgi:hypothetical protein
MTRFLSFIALVLLASCNNPTDKAAGGDTSATAATMYYGGDIIKMAKLFSLAERMKP